MKKWCFYVVLGLHSLEMTKSHQGTGTSNGHPLLNGHHPQYNTSLDFEGQI